MSDLSQQPKKRGRGRPRKYPLPLPEPIAYEAPESAINEEPADRPQPLSESVHYAHEPEPPPMKYIYQPEVITNINTSGLDLSDIAKKTVTLDASAPQRTNTPYNEPAEPMPMPTQSYEPMSSLTYSAYEPMPSLVPQPTAEEAKKRKVMLSKINRYKNSFEVLKGVMIDDSASMDDLEGKLEEMRLMISTKNSHTIFKTVYVTGVKAVEIVGGKTGMKLYGLADLTNKSPEIDSILKEIECEIDILNNVSPTNRLIIATVGCAIACDTINRRSEILQSFTKGAVNATINESYKDL